jgi:L-cystine uptake protein TcyP (sodium:dicarboxylate symporter family)
MLAGFIAEAARFLIFADVAVALLGELCFLVLALLPMTSFEPVRRVSVYLAFLACFRSRSSLVCLTVNSSTLIPHLLRLLSSIAFPQETCHTLMGTPQEQPNE